MSTQRRFSRSPASIKADVQRFSRRKSSRASMRSSREVMANIRGHGVYSDFTIRWLWDDVDL